MKIMKKSSNQFLERKILYNIVQSIPIICNQHLSALTCTYIHDTANISKLQQTCFHPIFASECFRAFSGQSFCTVLFPYQAVVSRTWFPYQFLCVANCLENALVPILVSYFFKHKTTTDFLQELSNSRLCHPLKNRLYRKWWGSSNIWGHASLESDPFSTEPGLNHFLEEILRGMYIACACSHYQNN